MRDGGLIKVRSWSPDGQVSDIEEFIFKAPRDLWEISLSPPDSPRSPELAVDSERGTFWEAGVSAESPLNLVIDMGEKREIRGFTYQPARREFLGTIERNTLEDTTHGAVNEYRLLGSEDGETWKVLAEGQFKYRKYAFLDSKRIDFPETVSCRYLKFTAISSINEGETVNVEDLSVY